MGLERRGNNYYYYRKQRTGSRVVSVYEGKGEIAQLMAQLEGLRREEKRLDKVSVLQRQVCETDEIDSKIDAACDEVSAYVDALFLTNGYHQHSRTWRRKRND